MFVKWQDHVYDFEIMIWNHVSDSGKSNAPLDIPVCLKQMIFFSYHVVTVYFRIFGFAISVFLRFNVKFAIKSV